MSNDQHGSDGNEDVDNVRIAPDARTKLDALRTDYNTSHPHSSLGNLARLEFARAASGAAKAERLALHAKV